MHEAIAAPLEAWASFYVIAGSSAGALTGLQFVVMTLIAQTGPARGREESIAAFGTPNVVHFCAALLVAAILTVPWSALWPAGVAVSGCGILGVIYSTVVWRRALRQRTYRPVFEDWLWHTLLTALAYSTLLVAGALLAREPEGALLAIAAAVLLLVFIGIHNAWDTVTYVTAQQGRLGQEPEAGASAAAVARTSAGPSPGAGPAASTTPGPASASDSPISPTP